MTINIYHHTVQVAMCAHMCLCTPVNGQVNIQKHHQCKLQVMTTMSISFVFAIRKNTTSTSCKWSRSSWKLVGAGCSNQMQVPQRQILVRVSALVQAEIGCCILLLLVLLLLLVTTIAVIHVSTVKPS